MVFFCSFFHCRDKQPIAGLAHWSIPERRNADINLPCIPQDVYLAIFDQIQRDEHGDDRNFKLLLINLSLVCRFFNAVFVPRLFESIRVLQDTRGKGPYPRAISFCKDLINDREPARTLGLHVRSCTFGKLGHRNLKFAQHSKAILRFVNLRSLSLSGIVITSTLFEAISALEHLTSLSINHSQLSPDLDSIPNLTLHLTSFTFVGIYSLSPFSGRLARLVASPSVRVLHTSCVDFLRVFMSQPIEFGLEELTFPLTGNAIPDLVRFLNRTPTITTLSFLIYSWETPMSFNGLLPSALPRLKALHCPSCLAADFIPGRPLKRINLDAPAIPTQAGVGFAETSLGDGCRLFSLLRQSTAAIEMLHVPVDMYYVASFGDNFPALRILHLECPAHRKQSEFTQNIEALCRKWNSNPPLTEFRIKSRCCWSSWTLNLEIQHQLILSSVVVAFPTLTHVVFAESVEWRKDNHKWRPSIPHFARLMLKSRLQLSSFPFVKDHDGCLASLFQPHELTHSMKQILGVP